MPGIVDRDLEFAFVDAIARRNAMVYGPIGLRGENVNAYEKTVIKSYMNIEYGSAATVEQLTSAYGYFGAVIDRIKAGGFDVPKDLQTAFDACERDLKYTIKGEKMRQLETLKLRRESLLSNEEKLKNIDAEINKLSKMLE